jgi:hypothetical protein
MDVNESDDLKTTLQKLLAERERVDHDIETIQRLLGLDQIPEELKPSESQSTAHSPVKTTRQAKIVPGEFYNMSQTNAVAAYLKKLGHAAHIDQILEAVQFGGVKISGDARTNLYTVLVRGTKRFVLVSPNTFGLAEFYPDRPKKEKKVVKKKRGKKKGKEAAAIQKPPTLPSPKVVAG